LIPKKYNCIFNQHNKEVDMPKARKHQIALDATPYYHCVAAACDALFYAALTLQQGNALNTAASGWKIEFYPLRRSLR
jgi:hypothetical protein